MLINSLLIEFSGELHLPIGTTFLLKHQVVPNIPSLKVASDEVDQQFTEMRGFRDTQTSAGQLIQLVKAFVQSALANDINLLASGISTTLLLMFSQPARSEVLLTAV